MVLLLYPLESNHFLRSSADYTILNRTDLLRARDALRQCAIRYCVRTHQVTAERAVIGEYAPLAEVSPPVAAKEEGPGEAGALSLAERSVFREA